MTRGGQGALRPAHPSFVWRSGIAEIGLLGLERRVRQTPICETFGRLRRADARQRPETDRAAPALRDIRRLSFERRKIFDPLRAAFLGHVAALCGNLSHAAASVARLCFALHCGDDFADTLCAHRSGPRPDFGVVHLSLHQRAGLPFRWSQYRAIGPSCQPPIFLQLATA